jgi:predicted porin
MSCSARRTQLCAGVALSVLIQILYASTPANAQGVTDVQIKALQAQIDQLQKTVKQLEAQQEKSNADAKTAKEQASHAEAQATQAKAIVTDPSKSSLLTKSGLAYDDWYIRHKPGTGLTFETPGGEISLYGNIDVSIEGTSKNVGSLDLNGATPPVGNFGWMPAISTNLSYFGIRGFQRIPNQNFNFVYQLEGGFEVSATPGLQVNNSSEKDTVNGALFSRNSFIGVASPTYGALKIGKEDAPYKTSTAAFNPFVGELGDYAVIMGNSGGDNRVEFGTRLDHAVWYESPVVNGFQWNLLFAPGQNRSSTSDNVASGESDCAGGDDPQSGGNLPVACNDGAFSDALSTNLSYTNGGFYATAAYEWHHNANRQSDITAMFGATSNVLPDAYSQALYDEDVADEDAMKIGALYKFSTGTTVGAIGERLHRYVSADLEFQNERSRYGTWAFVSQQLTTVDSIHFGWAHAFAAQGDPGQHNDATLTTIDGLGTFAPNDNQADMVTAAYKHMLSPSLTWYTDVAATFNGPSAHYDLGAGGRAVTTDCHDAFSTASGFTSSPHCYTGTTLLGASTGLQYKF